MISVLIPVFNVNVCSLVQELNRQLAVLSIDGEIVVYDDFSRHEFIASNKSITSLGTVRYKQLDKNIGRVAIRNLLAQDALNEWLLFIDSDSVIVNGNYLRNYLAVITKQQYDVYSGGRVYQLNEPEECSKRLHWKYGTKRESVQGVNKSLHSNNFCIRKNVFLELNFPPQIQGYGHEDTWMELALRAKGKLIHFIKNPVLHAGLEDSNVFLEKTRSALKNLLLLPSLFSENDVQQKVKLYRLFYWLKKMGLSKIVSGLLQKRIGFIEQNLNSCNPSLFYFDCYRLFYLLQQSGQSSKK